MGFWKWYKNIFTTFGKAILRPGWLKMPFTEYMISVFLLVVGSIFVSTLISPWWLFCIIPISLTGIFHAFWRYN